MVYRIEPTDRIERMERSDDNAAPTFEEPPDRLGSQATVSATRIEILLNELVVAEGLDRALTLSWTRPSSRPRDHSARGRSGR